MPEIKIINNDCLIALKEYPDNHFDSCVTDPPYGISFMLAKWDYDIPSIEIWKEVFRVLKPGGHILVACGTRTQHRMAVNIEDAGFEIKDIVSWVYASGFPKSLDISKAIDKHFNKKRKVIGKRKHPTLKDTSKTTESKSAVHALADTWERKWDITEPSTEQAKQWTGFKTALKPAQELWTLARKPLSEKTIAGNILKHGTGGINIDGCRISTDEQITNHSRGAESAISKGKYGDSSQQETHQTQGQKIGRFPANVIFDEEAGKILDEQSGILKSGKAEIGMGREGNHTRGIYGAKTSKISSCYADEGGASRFFYCAKASKSERNKGLENLDFHKNIGHNRFDKCRTCGGYILQNPDRPSACKCENPIREDNIITGNFHPTVKPINLMRYLVRLITPQNGKCLDPYAGSCTTGIALKLEGFDGVLIDQDKEYCDMGQARIDGWEIEKDENKEQLSLF